MIRCLFSCVLFLELKAYPEVASVDANIAVIEAPLLPSEVTGHKAILEFSRLLISDGQEQRKIDRKLDPSKKFTLYEVENGSSEEEWIPKVGDSVTVQNLVKKPEYNGNVGKIVSYSEETGRYGVKFTMKGEKEGENQVISLAIQRYNYDVELMNIADFNQMLFPGTFQLITP